LLTQAQINAIFTNMTKTFTVDGNDYTATVTYSQQWDNELTSPMILLNYISDAILKEDSVGKSAERDTALLSVDVFAYTDHTNGVSGLKISREIARTLLLWFKQSADALIFDSGLKILNTQPVMDMSNLEEKINRFHFEVYILYKFI